MKRFIIFITLICMVCLPPCCFAESILPRLSEPEEPVAAITEEVIMPSLEQVSWYNSKSITKSDDGRVMYAYSKVSENAYQKLGEAMAQAGYTLKDSSVDENGFMHFVAGDDANDMEIIYHEIGGDMEILYPMHASLAERDEESLTVHLQIGEPFKETEECVYALVYADAVETFRHKYKSVSPIMTISYDEKRVNDETTQWALVVYSCQSKVKYEIDNDRYYGDLNFKTDGFHCTRYGSGTSNQDFTLINALSKPMLAGNGTDYYGECFYYDPSVFDEPIDLAVTIFSEDKITRYVYDVSVGGNYEL